jgi:hypothetical protein
MSNLNQTITLQNVVDFSSTHVELMPLSGVGGFTSEPALSLCNDVLSELCVYPNSWKFNEIEMPPFVTAPYRQDYQFGGATAFTSAAGGAGIARSNASTPGVSRTGTTVTVTTLEDHNFAVGDTVYMLGNADTQFNSTYSQTPTGSSYTGGWVITATPTTRSFQFTHVTSGTTTSGAPGILDWGWLESASMRALNSTAPLPRIFQVEGVNRLAVVSLTGQPEKMCIVTDNGDGTVKIRFDKACPTTFFVVNAVYQAHAPTKTALSQFWGPFPDHLSFVYRQGFLARAYRYINSPKADAEYQKLQIAINKAMGFDDAEASDQRLYPEAPLMAMESYYDDF